MDGPRWRQNDASGGLWNGLSHQRHDAFRHKQSFRRIATDAKWHNSYGSGSADNRNSFHCGCHKRDRDEKNNATSTLSSIAIGDTVVVQGTVSGTNVTATTIRDGVMMRTPGAGMGMGRGNYASSTSPITGNGEPVVAGKVTSINGTTLAITNASNVSYTVDASNAKIVKGGTTGTATISNIAVGDQVVVQGTVSGSSVTATSVIDQVGGGANAPPNGAPGAKGFFGSIGSFFSHLFGF